VARYPSPSPSPSNHPKPLYSPRSHWLPHICITSSMAFPLRSSTTPHAPTRRGPRPPGTSSHCPSSSSRPTRKTRSVRCRTLIHRSPCQCPPCRAADPMGQLPGHVRILHRQRPVQQQRRDNCPEQRLA
jgi:hypothetical protein